jgi:hypothetical protein
MSIKMTVHGIDADGTDSLSGKTGEVLIVSFDDQTVCESPLTQKSLVALLKMKLGQKAKAARPTPAIPLALPGNGLPVVK